MEILSVLFGVFTAMLIGGLTGLGFRKWYRSPLKKRIKQLGEEVRHLSTRAECHATIHTGLIKDSIEDRSKVDNVDSGLQSLYEVVRNIDKDVKKLKKKAKAEKKFYDGHVVKVMGPLKGEPKMDGAIKWPEPFGGVPNMPCSQVQPSEAEFKGGYTSENDPEYYYYHANNKVEPGSTYKQIEFDNGTDMFTIVLNDGRKIASDITHIKNLLLKEANKLQ